MLRPPDKIEFGRDTRVFRRSLADLRGPFTPQNIDQVVLGSRVAQSPVDPNIIDPITELPIVLTESEIIDGLTVEYKRRESTLGREHLRVLAVSLKN